MAKQKGMTSRIEDAAITKLTAMKDNESVALFKTTDHWKHQINVGDAGVEDFARYAPFAFVKCMVIDVRREGDYDADYILRLHIPIGQDSKSPGICRTGDDTHVGTSQMADLVREAFDFWHPGSGFDCDDFHYATQEERIDRPNRHAIELVFEANWIPLTS
ncbi:MAG: hypothetical protein OEV87_12065 [Phycisphaerae bacterium]|nr:hypothetical protein [Phycisphaerae bacterium]